MLLLLLSLLNWLVLGGNIILAIVLIIISEIKRKNHTATGSVVIAELISVVIVGLFLLMWLIPIILGMF